MPPSRLQSIDILRGLVMVLMALDHTRGMVSGAHFDPTDLSHPDPALFLTRWVTHFCAPIFVFLAGTSAFLSMTRGKTKAGLSYFLLTRGLWLIFLEFTLVRMGWSFRVTTPFVVGQVIWVLGLSMIVLAGLIHLPIRVVASVGIGMIALHNLLDGLRAGTFGKLAWLWGILHGGYNLKLTDSFEFRPLYPLIPWVGVMATGYAFGSLLLKGTPASMRGTQTSPHAGPLPSDGRGRTFGGFVASSGASSPTSEPQWRRSLLLWLGLGITAAFLLVRGLNRYGDPGPWSRQDNLLVTGLSFVNCTKYPPSLDFLLMTLGPSLVLLALFDRAGPGAQPLIIFGRVPMFYYLLHIPLIHLLAVLISLPHPQLALGSFYFAHPPPDSSYGYALWVVYAAWLVVLVLLFPLCRWFAGVKQRYRWGWLSYL